MQPRCTEVRTDTSRHHGLELWAFAPWQLWVPNLAMPAACLLAAFGTAASNPLSFANRAPHEFDPDRPGVAGITRHPLLWALVLGSASHLLPNCNLAHVLLFGGFTAFALLGMRAIDKRFMRALGAAEWARLARRTSLVPFAAVAGGRWRPSGANVDAEFVMRLLGATVLYLTLLSLHETIVGVAPFPTS